MKEDDWSFVIKIHAFVEAAMSHLLTETVSRPELATVFARLAFNNEWTGKLAFAKALNVLDRSDRRFIRTISALRNGLVHDVRSVRFDLKAHVDALSKADLNELVQGLNWESDDAAERAKQLTFFSEEPKISVWFGALLTVGSIYKQKESVALRARTQTEKAAALEGLARAAAELVRLPFPPAGGSRLEG